MDKRQHISDKKDFEQAGKNLLRKVQAAESDHREEALASWKEIESRLAPPRVSSKFPLYSLLSVAASLAILLSIGLYFWMDAEKRASLSLALLEHPAASVGGNEVVLIEKDKKWQLKDNSSITYDRNGKSNTEKQAIHAEQAADTEEEVNQLIVPQGRKADITFSDGTKMYVNAGTRVFYPTRFKEDKREILVEGEVYLEVKKDPSRPFIVKTNGFDVKVLGTQFNICAYKGDASASVVLVSGSVEVRSGKNNKAILAPNQMMEIKKEGTEIKEVDVFEYTCWKENMMMLSDRKLGETLDRLSRYYGKTIWYNEEVGNIPISGKLDLRENLDDVIHILCQSLFLQYKKDENHTIIISK